MPSVIFSVFETLLNAAYFILCPMIDGDMARVILYIMGICGCLTFVNV